MLLCRSVGLDNVMYCYVLPPCGVLPCFMLPPCTVLSRDVVPLSDVLSYIAARLGRAMYSRRVERDVVWVMSCRHVM